MNSNLLKHLLCVGKGTGRHFESHGKFFLKVPPFRVNRGDCSSIMTIEMQSVILRKCMPTKSPSVSCVHNLLAHCCQFNLPINAPTTMIVWPLSWIDKSIASHLEGGWLLESPTPPSMCHIHLIPSVFVSSMEGFSLS